MNASVGESKKRKTRADTKDTSLLTIKCGNDNYSVVKSVICDLSPFFAKACYGRFKEAVTNEVNLPEDDPEAVAAMVRYVRKKAALGVSVDYMPPRPPGPRQDRIRDRSQEIRDARAKHMCLHAKVYALAEKYVFTDLKMLARLNFYLGLREKVLLDDFVDAVKIIYTTTIDTDRGLRDDVLEYINGKGAPWPGWQPLTEIPTLMYDIIIHLRPTSVRRPNCRKPGLGWGKS